MWNSLARSLVTCLIHDRWLCEKPWMKTISGPLGLPQSCAEMVRPSGVFTDTGLNGLSWAMAGAASAASSSVANEVPARQRRSDACIIGWVLPCVDSVRLCRLGARLEKRVGEVTPRQRAPSVLVAQGRQASRVVESKGDTAHRRCPLCWRANATTIAFLFFGKILLGRGPCVRHCDSEHQHQDARRRWTIAV